MSACRIYYTASGDQAKGTSMKCEIGDTAVQIAAVPGLEVNIGCMFEVVDRCQCMDEAWRLTAKQPCIGTVTAVFGPRITAHCPAGGSTCECDRYLQPIRPRKAPEAAPAPSRELEHS